MKKKILIADDDRDFVEVLRLRLEGAGYDTVCAFEGIRTIEMAHKEHPSLIILDWRMPAGKGGDVLKGLKEKNDTRHIPVIVLTGVSESEVKSDALNLGAADFVSKPYDARTLLLRIRELLELKTLEESLER